MKPPKFIGVFPSEFPGFGGPYPQHEHDGRLCTMFKAAKGFCVSNRFIPIGVSGIDTDGNCWVLVQDYAIDAQPAQTLRWKVFDVEVAE